MQMVCVLGNPDDLICAYVEWRAQRMGLKVLRLNEDLLGKEWSFAFEDAAPHAGRLSVGSTAMPFRDMDGVYVRLDSQTGPPPGIELNELQRHAFVTERRYAIHHLLESLPCAVANRPSAGRSNASKPYQMRLLQNAGFLVPEWRVSNDPAVIEDFCANVGGNAIYKACSGLRARVRRVGPDLLSRVQRGTCPVLIQKYIPGRDVRVHTVVESAFATEVTSSSTDFRFEDRPAEYRPSTIPDSLASLCCGYARGEGLVVAGFDFRVTSDDRWYCLEVNPVPSFMPYEVATGQPIATTLLQALLRLTHSTTLISRVSLH